MLKKKRKNKRSRAARQETLRAEIDGWNLEGSGLPQAFIGPYT